MKKFTKISLIIAAILGGVGILLCGIASVMGGGYSTIRQMARNGELNRGNWHISGHGIYYGVDDDDWDIDTDIDVDTDVDVETGMENAADADTHHGTVLDSDELVYEYAITGITNLDLDISAAELSFVEGTKKDSMVVRLYDCQGRYYEGGASGDTLKIKYKQEHDFYDNAEQIVIEIPAGMQFEKMDLDIGATDAEFMLKDVSCDTLLLDVGAGNIVADEFVVKEYMEANAGVGNVEINGGSYRDISLECGMGNFSMEGTLEGNLVAECGMGSMELKLKGDAAAYNYDLSCGLGELNVNGTKYSSIAGSHKVKNEGAIGTISLECGMGSLDLVIE